MEKEVLDFILNKKLILKGETIGVACSGGVDSMCLLNVLNNIKDKIGFKIIAVTIDHMIRGEESNSDCEFVINWCKKRGIVCKKLVVDALKISGDKNIGVEEAAREGRYNIFEDLLNRKIVDKIALAHHISDQVETVLLHIFRGSGLNGALGMSENRDNKFIRPLLQTQKKDIALYTKENNIKFVEDKTNKDIKYSRNFLRNQIIPLLKQKWPNFEQNIISFTENCKEDNDFILSYLDTKGVIYENNQVKIPISYFDLKSSIINRIIFTSLKYLSINKDIERKHVEIIKDLVKCENGKKVSLPNGLFAQKEYDYLCLYKKLENKIEYQYPFKVGRTLFGDKFEICIEKTSNFIPQNDCLILDADLVPEEAVFRTRKQGDKFAKFGSGQKSLKEFFIDKKIPQKDRDNIIVLANNNDILCVVGYEISEKVKITQKTKKAYMLAIKKI